MASEYNIKGSVTFEEYLECHKVLAVKRRLWIRGIITIYGIGMVIYAILFAPSKPDFTFAIIGAILIAYGIVISPIQFRCRVKRNWDRYPKIRKEFDIAVSSEGVETKDDKGRPSHSAWDSFLRFGESESLLLLYLSPLLPLCLPKRLIPEAELSGLRALLSSAIGNQTNGEQDVDPNA
ncbi:MAG: hypothetical protein WD342_10910 [Verrucomicrobiales bacterium]